MDLEPIHFLLITPFNWYLLLQILFLLILLVCSALISGTEIAFFSLSKYHIDQASDSKKKGIKTVIEQLKKPKRLLATILIANNFINILFIIIFTYVGDSFFANIESTLLKFLLEIVLVTFLILLFGEVLPKVYANRNAMKFALFMSKPIQILNYLFFFLSIPLMQLTNLVEKRLSKKQTDLSVETLTEVLKLATNDTSKEEKKILEGIVNFGNTETVQVMCPRIDVFAISKDEKFEIILKNIIKKGYSRIPVYSENIDNIKGILYTKDLLPHYAKKTFKWQSLIRDAFFVPENKKLDDLLLEFKDKKNHLAIVVDEYGGTSGLITLEDIIEEIVGDINDEYDDDEITYSKLDANNYIFDAKISLKDFYKVLNLNEANFKDIEGEAETLAGLILEIYEQFPKKNDIIKTNKLNFTIESLDKKRIKQVKVTIN
ncbi:MAG: gliding motility-associated protein GldE [Flavobacteriaceae bacterium]|nr:gliding motility-associated protein GldE [Flavobacteriaceae bacterium]